jgi:flagellar protein FlaF
MYESAVRQVLSGRELEAAVLRKSAMRLRHCQKSWARNGVAELAEALEINQKIWSVFQADLLEPSNPLPQELRANLLRLSLIVDRQTLKILAEPSPEQLDLLIDINLAIAEGLISGAPRLHVVPPPASSEHAVSICA